MLEGNIACGSCGKQVRHSAHERPCERLAGWVMVTQWGGPGSAEHHFFCCTDCLKAWTDARGPEVPDVFIRAFDE